MADIYKPKNSRNWYVDFIDASGNRIRKSSGTQDKRRAQELCDKLKVQSWREKKLGDKPKYTWQQAVLRYLNEQENSRTLENTKGVLRYLCEHLNDKTLDSITRAVIEEGRLHKKSTGVKNSTVNRTMTVLRAVLNAAREWEWLDNAPKVKMFSDDSARVRFLTYDEASRLLAELRGELRVMAKFTLATGLRASNVIGLRWSEVAWVKAENSAIAVPLNDDAMRVLREQVGKNSKKVFIDNQRQLSTKEFTNAVKRAGIDNFRWHDLRYTWASWHIQNGTPLHVLKELGG